MRIELVLLDQSEPIHPDSLFTAFEDIEDATLQLLVHEALADVPGEVAEADIGNVDRLPECGFSITTDQGLSADPGCCSSMSSVEALIEQLLEARHDPTTIFTGHDCLRFVATSSTSKAGEVKVSVSGGTAPAESFELSKEQANQCARHLQRDLNTAVQRVVQAIPSEVASQFRPTLARHLLGLNGPKYW